MLLAEGKGHRPAGHNVLQEDVLKNAGQVGAVLDHVGGEDAVAHLSAKARIGLSSLGAVRAAVHLDHEKGGHALHLGWAAQLAAVVDELGIADLQPGPCLVLGGLVGHAVFAAQRLRGRTLDHLGHVPMRQPVAVQPPSVGAALNLWHGVVDAFPGLNNHRLMILTHEFCYDFSPLSLTL